MQDHLTCEEEEAAAAAAAAIHPAVECGGLYPSACNKLQNKFHVFKHQEGHEEITIWDWLKKFCFDFAN